MTNKIKTLQQKKQYSNLIRNTVESIQAVRKYHEHLNRDEIVLYLWRDHYLKMLVLSKFLDKGIDYEAIKKEVYEDFVDMRNCYAMDDQLPEIDRTDNNRKGKSNRSQNGDGDNTVSA